MEVAERQEAPPLNKAEVEERRALVGRVVESTAFAKSQRLSTFLSCICDLTLTGRSSEINEQKIGVTVFGRTPDYDSSIDGIVRPQASRLRQRLDLYFSSEGLNEPLRIMLPRGTYVPIFKAHFIPEPATDAGPFPLLGTEESPPVELLPQARSGWADSRRAWGLAALLLCLCAFGIQRATRTRTPPFMQPNVNLLWSSLFVPNDRTTIVPSDTGLVMWQGATKKNVNLESYLSGEYRATSTGDRATGQIDAADLASRRYTSIVDLNIVKGLTQIADSEKSSLDVRYARDLRPNDLKDGNLILIGAAAADPWVELFDPQMNFVFSNAHLRGYTIENRHPEGKEPPRWNADYDDPQHHVYGVVAFLANPSGKGNVLLLEGTSMAGTECAWDFVANDSSLLPFLDRIRRSDGTMPHFQLILESVNLTGSSVKRNVLAWRVAD